MKVVAIIQARMGSSRLPGKVLREVAGRPLLAHVLERTLACKSLDQVVVATTDAREDIAIVEIAKMFGVPAFAGSRDNVLDRYYRAAQKQNADVIVRITADCPLIDPTEVDRVVNHFLNHPILDYVSTGHTYPEGYGVEVFRKNTLEKAWQEAELASEREHVTPYIWKNADRFKVERIELQEDLSRFRLTVDEECDLMVVTALLDALAPGDSLFGMGSAVTFLKANTEIAAINSHITRQAGYWKSVVNDGLTG